MALLRGLVTDVSGAHSKLTTIPSLPGVDSSPRRVKLPDP